MGTAGCLYSLGVRNSGKEGFLKLAPELGNKIR